MIQPMRSTAYNLNSRPHTTYGGRKQLRLITALSALIAALVLVPTEAQAHLRLEQSTPVSDARLSTAPESLRFAFSLPIELAFSRVSLVGPTGEVGLAPVELAAGDERVLIAPIRSALVAGIYTVRWQVAGPDGHPVRGEYSFTIEPGASGLAPPAQVAGPTAPGQTPPPAEHHDAATFPTGSGFGAESPLYAAVRWLTFVGLLGVIGVVAFRLLVLWLLCRNWDPAGRGIVGPAARRAATVALGAVAVLAVALILRLYAQSYALHGAEQTLNLERIGTMLTQTTWGWGWLLQAGGTAAAFAGFILARREDGRAGWAIATLGTVLLAFTPALSGHAIATPELSALAVLADGLHVLGAGGWLGSLLLVVIVGIPVALRRADGDRGEAVAALINAFSPTALFFAGGVIATGVFAAWLHLETVPALWESAYGRTLLLKLAVLSIVFGTGAYNWLRVKPALGDEAAAGRLRRSATLELAVGLVVLAVTAVLVATPPPADMEVADGAFVPAALATEAGTSADPN